MATPTNSLLRGVHMRFLSLLRCLAGAAAFAIATPQAHAESFTYNFSSYEPGGGYYSFTYDSPSLITTDESGLTPASCSALGASCDSVSILASSGEVDISGTNSLEILGLPASFFQVGSNIWNFSTMQITENAGADVGPSAVPEPSTLALLGTGVLGVAEIIRRRRRVA